MTWPVLRGAGSYGIGDVVAYRSPTLGTTVMHRIVALDGDAFVTQGDNNSWQDPDHPTTADIKGRLLAARPPGRRRAAAAAATVDARPAAVVAGPAVVWVLRPRAGRHRRGRRRPTAALRRPAPGPVAAGPPAVARDRARQAALGCAAVALLAGACEAVLLALPATQTDTKTVVVGQQVRWDWSGTAVAGATYPTGRIATGDPVYTRLAGPVTVSLRDTVSAAGLTGLTGAVRLVLGVQSADGWHATSPPASRARPPGHRDRHRRPRPGRGDRAAAPPRRRGRRQRRRRPLTVTPQVALTGASAAGPHRRRRPRADLHHGRCRAARQRRRGRPHRHRPQPAVTADVVTPRRLELGPVDVPLDVAGIAVGVLAVAAVAAAGACALAGRPAPGGPADDGALRASARLLPVRRFTPGRQVVDVEDGAALLRLAERLDLLVLHTAGDGDDDDTDVFAVQDGETTYRWTAAAAPAERAALRVVTPVACTPAR